MKSRKIVELAHDIQTGLGRIDVPDFDQMRTMGMASTLAIHIRGLGEIDYEVLRKVSDHFFNIPSFALKEVISVLAEIEYVQIAKKRDRIDAIIPDVPRFQDVYDGLGEFYSFADLNEHEQGTLLILAELQTKPENRNRLVHRTGIDAALLKRCVDIGSSGHYIKEYRARGRDLLASPFYFADNLDGLVDITAKVGADDIKRVLEIVKMNQGWPLSIIRTQLEIGGSKLSKEQNSLLMHMCGEGILKPPSIDFRTKRESFVFTPAPGAARLNMANREIYERAMALVSCVRKGQLLADQYRIKMPLRLLLALRDRGYLGANSEAAVQYQNLVFLRVGKLRPVGSNRWQFHLISTEENIKAIEIAINLLRTGELSDLDVDEEARIALSRDEKYIQSIISSAELQAREHTKLSEESASQFEQLLLGYE